MSYWDSYEFEEPEVDLSDRRANRRAELREEMCGWREPSDLLSLAIYETVLENLEATSDDVFDMYLRLAAEEEQRWSRDAGDHRAA